MATSVDALARELHHGQHIFPTWLALPDKLRGTFYVHPQMLGAAKEAGVDAVSVEGMSDPGPLTLVASYRDLKWARARGRRVVYSEHGAGQSYVGVRSGSYIGALDRAGVVAVLVPGHDAAQRHAAVHPAIPAYPVGCPKLDRWHGVKVPRNERPVVAISFHWACKICPETKGAFNHYRQCLPRLAKQFQLLGHGHPRMLDNAVRRTYERAGIEVVESFDEVIERADVYAVDNSSTLYEWAALDRRCVVLNAPWFRKRVDHGLRFWSHADVGPTASGPKNIAEAIQLSIEDPPDVARRRREIAADVYVAVDDKAATRAARVVRNLAKEWS